MSERWEHGIISSEDVGRGGFVKGKPHENAEAYLNGPEHERCEIVDIDFPGIVRGRTAGITQFLDVSKRPAR